MRLAVLVIVAVALAGCGGSDVDDRRPPPPGHEVAALRLGCDESWWPNRQTFASRTWRRDSVRAGPVIFVGAKRLAEAPVRQVPSVKISTLVRPDTRVGLAVGRGSAGAAGFVPQSNGFAGLSSARPAIELAACPGVPRPQRAVRGIPHVGFPVSIAAARPACLTIDVTAGTRTHRARIPFGVACS